VKKGLDLYLKNLISRIGFVREETSIAEKSQKEIFVFIYFIFCVFSLVCLSVLLTLGKERASIIPILYIFLAGTCTYLISKNYVFKQAQGIFSFITILLPFILQYYLGGISKTGFLMLWSSLSILNVISLKKNFQVFLWIALFFALALLSFALEALHFPENVGKYSSTYLGFNFIAVAYIHFGLSRYVIFHQIRLRKKLIKNQDKLERMNDHLYQRNSELNDSLDYAETLQRSILPKSELLEKKFQEIKVFFKPKEVIGGDFYWFGESDGKKIFAIIDCTGHGIPGAFVSMMGYNLLNHIILSKRITYPGFILNQLNKLVKESLRQESSGNKDGMDMSIISYDPLSRSLEFAGAKSDLYYMDDENGLMRIRGSRCSIGGFNGSKEAEYETHTIQLKDKTKFFMTTDGLVDQFGGNNDKRFSSKRLHNHLLKLLNQEVNSAAHHLVEMLENWKGNTEQLDEILFSVFSIDPQKDLSSRLKIKRYDKKRKSA